MTVKVEMDDTVRALLEQANAELTTLRQRAEAAREQVAALREALENARESMAFLRSCLYSGEDLDSDDIKHIDDVFAEIRAALTADATQAGERWRAEREVLESATRWREAMRGLDALARTAVWGEQELAGSRRLAAAQSEALLQLTSALDRLAALGEEAGE